MVADIPCVLFAGGKSSRMGSDKALLPFGGFETLAEFQYRRLEKIFTQVFISTKQPSKFPFQADFIIDASEVFAPTAGFCAIFDRLKNERVFVLGVDMPFVDETVIKKIMGADRMDFDATIADINGRSEALCGVYHRSLHPHFQKMLQEDKHKLAFLLDEVKTKKVPFEKKELFFNLNRPQEYQKAKELYDIIA